MLAKKKRKIASKNKKKTTNRFKIASLIKHINYYQQLIQSSILSIQSYKSLGILNKSEIHNNIKNMEFLYITLKDIKDFLETPHKKIELSDIESRLQDVNKELENIFKYNGCDTIKNLLIVVFDEEYINNNINNENKDIYNLINKHVKPIGYKTLSWKDQNKHSKNGNGDVKRLARNRIVEDYMIVQTAKTLDCFDLARTSNNFHTKVYGIKITFQNIKKQETLIISGIIDDVIMTCTDNDYINTKLNEIIRYKPKDAEYQNEDFDTFVEILTLKEIIIYSRSELYQRYRGYLSQINLIKQRTITQVVNDFIGDNLFKQRKTLIQLLMKKNDPEFQYLSYLLYNLLPNDDNTTIDAKEQTILHNSLPWKVKNFFSNAMETTLNYTNKISKYDTNNIPLEQQICLMKVSESVKEKAMIKLKEVKAKSEDSGSKARQFLDGLLKIPFGVYKQEHMLNSLKIANDDFKALVDNIQKYDKNFKMETKEKYNIIELTKSIKYIKDEYIPSIEKNTKKNILNVLTMGQRDNIKANLCFINSLIKKHNIKKSKLCHSGKKNKDMKDNIKKYIKDLENNDAFINDIILKHPSCVVLPKELKLKDNILSIEKELNNNKKSLKFVNETLDKAIHGHKNAKRQVERIIGQWITGKQSGYCFGFEGAPGVGKTSLAKKGLSCCLKDADGKNRPFSFIALGGSCNGSTLAGHNYTYVGSTWGKIVDILMETKCMNPIIFIDELDKVSRTEHGKEIIGILTHLVDSTQNSGFQDKYFRGIDIDLSKVLFIFSYNDPSLIDKILLDRIHRVRFEHLDIDDKLEITKSYMLPEIYEKIGIAKDTIVLEDDIIIFIIDYFTRESGVRKLREILFEIISEINLEILNGELEKTPLVLTKEMIKTKYLKDRHQVYYVKIHDKHSVGLINGLWANAYGMGGIIQIECNFLPSNTFMDLKLTGMQGDVMKESMNVAKTLAWKLTSTKQQNALTKKLKRTKQQGIHIHCPEGATPKDGPSAGTAITTVVYSLLNDKKIKNNIAITGEMNLQGKVTKIGGLDLKILGGIRAGVKTFLFPKENKKEFDKFYEKYKDKDVLQDITFHQVSKIEEVFKLVFV